MADLHRLSGIARLMPLVLAACAGGTAAADQNAPPVAASVPPPSSPPPFSPAPSVGGPVASTARCSAPPHAAGSFTRKRSRLIALGHAHHGVVDVVVSPGEASELVAKFTYGPTSKDLSGERIGTWSSPPLQRPTDCPSWSAEGDSTTDSDGMVRLPVPAASEPGRHPAAFVVAGDGTFAEGASWVVASPTQAVVFDVDGTLTEGDEALIEQLVSGHSPPARDGAAAVARRHAEGGALPIYITGRPLWLAELTRAWLRDNGFPLGPLLTTSTPSQAMGSGVQEFKRAALVALADRGVRIERAYGNAVTDICAYAQAGIPAAQTFIAGAHGGEACDEGQPTRAFASYRTVLADLGPVAK